MIWDELNKIEAENVFKELLEERDIRGEINNGFENFTYQDVPREYKKLYFDLDDAYDDIKSIANNEKYKIDYLFGIELYKKLRKYGFSNHDACNNEIWSYLSLKVIPNIVYDRWEDNANRFYKIPNRIWLKSIWWFVFLSLYIEVDENGNEKINYDKTKEIMSTFNADYILQIVDRAGLKGFNVELMRKLIYKFYINIDLIKKNNIFLRSNHDKPRETMRSIMVWNTARLKVYDPQLCEDGIDGYLNIIFKDAIVKELWDEIK